MNKDTLLHTPEQQAALQTEQLMMFVELRKKTFVPIGLVLIITWSLWHTLALSYLLPWMGLILVTLVARFLLTPQSIENLTDEAVSRATYWAWFCTMLSCGMWGIGGALAMGFLPLMQQMLLIVLLVGQTGAVMGYVTDKKYAFAVHILSVPVMIWLLLQEDMVYVQLGVLIGFYILFMQASLGAQYQRFARTVHARLEYESLVHALKLEMVEKRSVEQQLREKSKEAEKANRAKSNFIAVVSHELRTPVHGLIGMLDLLHGVRMPKESRIDLKNARRAARNLRVLVNDILDLSKAEAGKMELNIAPFHIEECVHDAMMPCMVLAEKQHTKVAIEFANVPSTIHGDAGKIRQILLNLIGNAVKFTEHGRVLIHVEAKGDKRLAFQVQDTGVGIAKEDLSSIFEPFVQVKNLMERQHDGTGLGISIAQKFVQQMGGVLQVESELSKGSNFFFEVDCTMEGEMVKRAVKMSDSMRMPPFDAAEDEAAILADTKLSVQKKWKVLVAEDDPISRRIALKRLGRVGFDVTAAEDGDIAWKLLQQHKYDLILLDIRMPGMDGVNVARHIRQHENPNKGVPIIGLSAHATRQVMDECLRVGMNDFLMKPIEPAVIVQKMQQALL